MKWLLALTLSIVALSPTSLPGHAGTIADGYGPVSYPPENVAVIELPQSSTARPQITVRHDGKPIGGAKLYVYRFRKDLPENYPQKLHLNLATNVNGRIVLPRLDPGIYKVAASSGPNLKGEILLSIAPESSDPSYVAFELNLIHAWGNPPGLSEASAFLLELGYYPTKDQILAQEEQLPVTKIAAFQGTVSDISGAEIPHASIAVTRTDSPGEKRTKQLTADDHGRFAASLPAGDYIATFSSQGFRMGVRHLNIAEWASNQPLQIRLQVGESQ